MNTVVRDVLKWVLALGVLAGICVYALGALPEALGDAVFIAEEDRGEDPLDDPVSDAPGVEPIEDGVFRPTSDFSIIDGVVGDRSADRLVIGEEAGAAVIIAFPLNAGSPSCVVDVRLEVEVEDATQSVLGIYPSGIADLDAVVEGGPPPSPPILDPAGVEQVTDGTPVRLGFDVTELYRTWASRVPFPGGSTAGESELFVVALSPPAGAPEDGREVELYAADAGDPTAPTIGFVGDPACRSAAPAGPLPPAAGDLPTPAESTQPA